jgi:nucleoside-diphosphate-sugar epimerase
VFGGEQLRPNLHIDDMTDLYLQLLEAPDETIDGKTWNAGYHNFKVREIADMVRDEVGKNVDIIVTPSNDNRSYHVSSEKIKKDLGFSASRTVSDAIVDLREAFHAGRVPNAMTDDRYYNIKRMQALKLR